MINSQSIFRPDLHSVQDTIILGKPSCTLLSIVRKRLKCRFTLKTCCLLQEEYNRRLNQLWKLTHLLFSQNKGKNSFLVSVAILGDEIANSELKGLRVGDFKSQLVLTMIVVFHFKRKVGLDWRCFQRKCLKKGGCK